MNDMDSKNSLERWGSALGGEQGTGREEEVTENTFTFPLASSLPCFETMIAFLFTKEISEIGALTVKSGNQNLS